MVIGPTIEYQQLGCGAGLTTNAGANDFTAHSLMQNTQNSGSVLDFGCGLEIFFFSEKEDSGRDAWADGLRGLILERLAGDENGWWLNMRGDLREPYGQATVWRNLTEVLAEEAALRYSGELRPWQYWQSAISNGRRHDFVYVSGGAVKSTVERHWGHAHPGWNLEGCCIRDGERMRAFDWLQADQLTCGELLDRCEFLMISCVSEYRHLSILTNKYDVDGIRARIQWADLERKVATLSERVA